MIFLKDKERPPDNPGFPTSDLAHEMAAGLARKRNKKYKGKILNGVELEL